MNAESTAATRGRAALAEWVNAQPEDLFADDAEFGALVDHHGLGARKASFHAAGQVVAGPLDRAVRENNLHRNLPVLDDWDSVGRATGGVSHHPTWRDAGRLIYGTGVMAAYGEATPSHQYILGLFYLTGQAGEAGHNCPLACAAGAIRALQALGTESQRERFLAPLLDPDFDTNFTAAQFLTEVQGGSDVGANSVQATPLHGDGARAGDHWRIDGEKWFCSNADADVFLLTARVAAPESGTRGLGLFLVPRLRADGSPNGFRLRRLKDKLGTRSLASGEIDFVGAEAEALGPAGSGFKNVMTWVINTSRLYNAVGCAAHARRAWVIASLYAQHRTAFGQPIGEYPLIQETLAWMRADATACLAGSMWLAGLQERADAGELSTDEGAFFRVAVNLNKLRTSLLAHDAVNHGIEVLGGNGAIETFSILPRLLRDNIVYENWEGSHNVLRAQVLRDCARYGVHKGFFAVLRASIGDLYGAELEADEAAMEAILEAAPALRDLRFRRLADRLAIWVMIAGMRPVASLDAARELTLRHVRQVPLDDAYLATVTALQR
jgi:acyl-CoA dehydrogenase